MPAISMQTHVVETALCRVLQTVFQIFNILKHVRVTCEYDIQTDRQRDGRMDSLHDSKLLHFIVLHAQPN